MLLHVYGVKVRVIVMARLGMKVRMRATTRTSTGGYCGCRLHVILHLW